MVLVDVSLINSVGVSLINSVDVPLINSVVVCFILQTNSTLSSLQILPALSSKHLTTGAGYNSQQVSQESPWVKISVFCGGIQQGRLLSPLWNKTHTVLSSVQSFIYYIKEVSVV